MGLAQMIFGLNHLEAANGQLDAIYIAKRAELKARLRAELSATMIAIDAAKYASRPNADCDIAQAADAGRAIGIESATAQGRYRFALPTMRSSAYGITT
ncbi:MAG TPA: hypothetical protein VI522_02720 [Gammaproteobacteria bacterium]|nr:hypothetical protein [Gammaproteobacteria bacterium]